MKLTKNQIALWVAAVGIGSISALMRKRLYWSVDERGLLIPGQPEVIGLLALTVIAVVFILVLVRPLAGSDRYEDNFGPSGPSALGHFLLAAGILATAVLEAPKMGGYLGLCWQVLGYVAPVCLVAAGIARLRGKQPFFLLHLAVCLYFVFHVVNQYRSWSGNPQLLDYLFALFGSIALILFSYYQTAFDVGTGKRRPMLVWGFLGIYLCLVNLAKTEYPLVYAGGVMWIVSNLCSLTPKPIPEDKGEPHDPA